MEYQSKKIRENFKRTRFNKHYLNILEENKPLYTAILLFFKKKLSYRIWRAHIGLEIEKVEVLWIWLNREGITTQPIYLLWTLYYLRRYPTTEELELLLQVDHKTFKKHTEPIINFLYNHLNEVVFVLFIYLFSN